VLVEVRGPCGAHYDSVDGHIGGPQPEVVESDRS
jgi:hypothetical protein